MNSKFFPASDPKSSVPKDEETIMQYWKDHDIFKRSVEERSPEHQYRFFDGPPFATGLPHYGHMIGGTLKDAIPRYWTMKGYRVERKFGWDCHGLPVEFLVEKENNINGKPGIEEIGVGTFNELCRSAVDRYSTEWRATVDRMGRFVDMDDDYKTMDLEFMESVWWVFGQMWDKGYVYEGEKVLAYSPKLGSPLSNMEANLNYKDIDDPAVTASFSLQDGNKVLAWTTTPWTLPSNVGLGFGKDHSYVLVAHEGEQYWIAEEAAERYFGEDFEVVGKKTGVEFKGMSYEPLFPFFGNSEEITRFECVHDDGDYITTGEGTGIVHFAPAFGEEDAKVCDQFQLYGLNPINDEGYFEFETANATRKEIPTLVNLDAPEVSELNGRYFRDDPEVNGSKENNANDWVIQNLKEQGKLFKRDQIRHSYPHCWRTECALMYRGVKTWFIDVQKIKSRMLELNEDINWIPDHVKHGRFGKIVEGAPDWAISRNRYWGTPIPVWRCDQTGEVQVVSSATELSELCGQEVTDLHKHFVDDYTWENPKTGGTMVRIPEVFDCWVESGSMPYASIHYPFASKDFFGVEKEIPVEKAVTDDQKESCWQFFLQMWKEEFEMDNSSDPARRTIFSDSEIFFIEEDGQVIGAIELCFDLEKKIWRVGRLGVLEEKRLQDYGTALMNKAAQVLLIKGESKIVTGGEENSLEFYKKLGFTQTSELQPTKTNPDVQYAWVEKELWDFQGADFIAEGIDQTRCWFYVLHVLGCALFDKPIYKNVVINGIVLAEDGQKMSKSKQNYPAPELIFDKYGADAMRFYMLQSPAVHAEDLRFSEQGVEEILKSVILPLKSTYNFLSTYANIDDWNPTTFVTVRHGEAQHNLSGTYSYAGQAEHHLTDKGIQTAKETAQNIPKLDVLYSSPFTRCRETAEIINENQNLEIQYDDRLEECNFGPTLDGKPYIPLEQRHTTSDCESRESIIDRIESFVSNVSAKNPGKTIGIVSHGAPLRNLHRSVIENMKDQNAYLRTNPMPLGQPVMSFAPPMAKTDLDRWILSELQTLLQEFRTNFDAYDIEGALRLIAPFVDRLNNWYLRRSRSRFWSDGMSDEKRSGYETLHHVLFTLAKILAPVMPFFAEKLYQDLGGLDSVHLQLLPYARDSWIDRSLEDKTNTMREIVSLGATIRARAKIKLRQPLGKLRFALAQEVELSAHDLEIIAQEANVKEVEILSSVDGIAKQIIKVDAKKVGRKFGKKTQQLIVEGKAGNFEMKDDGVCFLCDEQLEADEYEVGFLTEEGVEAEATREVVVLVDTEITEDLKVEGFAREIIRAVQETRKNNGFDVSDRIKITYATDSELIRSAFANWGLYISENTLATEINEGSAEQEFNVDGEKFFISLTQLSS